MKMEEEKCQVSCYEACEGCGTAKDPEDAILDPKKMTPEEMKDYLDSLLENRTFGC